MSSSSKVSILFKADRATKNTVRFSEICALPTDSPVIGTMYVPKATLTAIGYKDTDTLSIDLSIKGPATAQ